MAKGLNELRCYAVCLQLEEPSRTELISAAPWSEHYRGSKIRAILPYQEEQAAYQGRDGLVSPVSQQQSLLPYRSIIVVQRCCHGSGSALCHVDSQCSATWCSFTQPALAAEARSAGKYESSPCLVIS